jgi:hypothetical protein
MGCPLAARAHGRAGSEQRSRRGTDRAIAFLVGERRVEKRLAGCAICSDDADTAGDCWNAEGKAGWLGFGLPFLVWVLPAKDGLGRFHFSGSNGFRIKLVQGFE